MSVEDEELDFLSDEADEDEDEDGDEAERNDDHVAHYAELLMLHRNMMRFDHIHLNGVVLDLLNEDENDNDSGFFHNWVEDMMSAFSSVMEPEDWSTSDSDDVGQRYAPFYEDTFSSCSYSSDSGADRWPPWTPNGSAEATNFTPDGTEAEAEAGPGPGPGPGPEAEATEQ